MDNSVTFSIPVPTNTSEISLKDVKLNYDNENLIISKSILHYQNILLNNQKTPCNVNDVSWLTTEKEKILKHLLNEKQNITVPQTSGEGFIELYKTIVEENHKQLELLKHIKEEMKIDEDVLAELKTSLQIMKVNMENDLTTDEPEKKNLGNIQLKVSQKFQEVRKNLITIFDTCYPHENTKNIIKALTEAYFTGGEQSYVEVIGTECLPDVELLKKSSLIMHHPYDKSKIKFNF